MKKYNKITIAVMLLAAAGFLLQSCGKDNQVAYPTSIISGKITYNGEPVGLMSTNNQLNSGVATQNLNTFFLRQTGPQPLSGGDLRVVAKSDGTFTYPTFDGEYTILPVPYKAPYQNFAPISFTLKGNQTVDIPVTPYFWVSNVTSTFVDSVLNITFRLDRTTPNYVNASGATVVPDLEFVRVYFGTTNKADNSANIFQRGPFTTTAQGININGNCTLSINLKGTGMTTLEKQTLKAQTGKLFARIGIKTRNITDPLFAKVIPL
jgi:hypothetical protein